MVYPRIKYLRNDKELTQQEIAKILNINQSTYSDYETGEICVPIDTLIRLSNLYDTSIDYIVGRTDIKEPYPKSKLNKR